VDASPVIPDLDIWEKAFSRRLPDPKVVHEFTAMVQAHRIWLLGWVRQGLLGRIEGEREWQRLSEILSAYPDLPVTGADHIRAAAIHHGLHGRIQVAPWPALMWAVAERIGGSVWTNDRRWQQLRAFGCPVRGDWR
jgi:predicted nucleic acid-binding protein